MIETNNNNSRRILCVGMCVLDIVHVCNKYPEEDTDRRCLKGYWQRGGNASNNCTVLRNLNTDCEFLGMLSESPAFGFLHDDCRKRGIRIDNCPITAQDPPFSSVLLSQESDSRTIIHSNSNFPILTFEHFKKINLSDYSWIHFEGRNPEETLQMIDKIHEFNRNHDANIKISVELEKLKLELLELASQSDYVFLGKELALFMGWQNGREAVEKVQNLFPNRKRGIICTWGSKGAYCLTETGDFHHIEPCPPREIVDALGAGDTFCAAVIYGLDRMKLTLEKAVELGNRVAGFKLGHCGYDDIRQLEPEKLFM
ncbi:ketohexokinase-like [Episyrphus balteatus]|uniref:ketohexokinase-like n=1 Tax=Episyrphus balteatus TaxID=286459 RepID=UPI002485F7B4|nr:ketohexokinase-like [Episyrphus balteatus]